MLKDNILTNITDSIDTLADRAAISRSRAFAAWFAITFYDIDEDDALESAASDGGNDQGIDLVFIDESSQEIVILQAHCSLNFTTKTPKKKWDALTASIPFVIDPIQLKHAGRPDLAETLTTIIKEHPSYSKTLGLITLGLHSEQIERAVTAQQKTFTDKSFKFFYLAQEDISTKYNALIDSEAGIPEDNLNFDGSFFEDSGDYGRAWIGSVNAGELNRLYTKHKNKLFAGNIRLFLGARKGGINEQIIKTAKETPGLFWALNNGITVVADNAIQNKDGKSLTLKRFSIVNGCQTTSSLVDAGTSEKTKVLARVIAAKTGLKNEIVRFNNSQNAVKIWTVRAVDNIQEELRRSFSKIGIEYAPKQSGSRQRKNDVTVIQLDKVTQFLASREQVFLIQAINNKGELFDEPYQRIFKVGIKAREVYLAWLVGTQSDISRQERLKSLEQESTTDVNTGLLSVSSSHWITFFTYKMLEKFSDLESPHITLEKMHSIEFTNTLKKYIEKAVDIFYEAAIDTYERDEYGTFKSTLRSTKFLQKMDSKVNNRLIRMGNDQKIPADLVNVCKSIKL